MKAGPLTDDLSSLIEKETIGPKIEAKERGRILVNDFNWDKTDASKIWCFGPDFTGANMLVDTAKGV